MAQRRYLKGNQKYFENRNKTQKFMRKGVNTQNVSRIAQLNTEKNPNDPTKDEQRT